MDQNQQKQLIVQQSKKGEDRAIAEEQKRNSLITRYNQIPNRSIALLADRIASYIPANLFLFSMNVFPVIKNTNSRDKKELSIEDHTIRLKGVVETPGSITLLSQLLEADTLFTKVKIVRMERRKDSDMFGFEMEITL